VRRLGVPLFVEELTKAVLALHDAVEAFRLLVCAIAFEPFHLDQAATQGRGVSNNEILKRQLDFARRGLL